MTTPISGSPTAGVYNRSVIDDEQVLANTGAEGQGGAEEVDGAQLTATLRAAAQQLAGLPGAGSARQVSSALSLPEVASPGVMANLTTADLMQLIRKAAKETSEALIAATMTQIKAQQDTIAAKHDEKIAKLNKAQADMDKAEKKQKEMNILKWAMYGLAALVIVASLAAAVFTGGASVVAGAAGAKALVATAVLVTTVCLSEIKDDEGKSTMDKMMEKLTESLKKDLMGPDGEPLVDDPDGVASMQAMVLMIYLQVLIMALVAVATMGAGAGAGAAQTAADAAAKAAAKAAEAASALVQRVAQTLVNALKFTTAALALSSAGVGISKAFVDRDVAESQADIQKLKALIKYLQTLIQGDFDFTKQIMELQAQLDMGVARIVGKEHQLGEQIASNQMSMS